MQRLALAAIAALLCATAAHSQTFYKYRGSLPGNNFEFMLFDTATQTPIPESAIDECMVSARLIGETEWHDRTITGYQFSLPWGLEDGLGEDVDFGKSFEFYVYWCDLTIDGEPVYVYESPSTYYTYSASRDVIATDYPTVLYDYAMGQADYSHWAQCYQLDPVPYSNPDCRHANLDGHGIVGIEDKNIMLRVWQMGLCAAARMKWVPIPTMDTCTPDDWYLWDHEPVEATAPMLVKDPEFD